MNEDNKNLTHKNKKNLQKQTKTVAKNKYIQIMKKSNLPSGLKPKQRREP